jgi:transposase
MNSVYIGLDVHQKQSFYCAMNLSGEVLGHEKIPTERGALEQLVKRYSATGEVEIALEAGGSSWWVAHVLRSSGAKVEVVNAHELKLIAHSKRKTDKYDSKVLANLLRCKGLPEPVYQPSEWAMRLRCQLKVRKWVVRQHAQTMVRAKSLMRHLGGECNGPDVSFSAVVGRSHGEDTVQRDPASADV